MERELCDANQYMHIVAFFQKGASFQRNRMKLLDSLGKG